MTPEYDGLDDGARLAKRRRRKARGNQRQIEAEDQSRLEESARDPATPEDSARDPVTNPHQPEYRRNPPVTRQPTPYPSTKSQRHQSLYINASEEKALARTTQRDEHRRFGRNLQMLEKGSSRKDHPKVHVKASSACTRLDDEDTVKAQSAVSESKWKRSGMHGWLNTRRHSLFMGALLEA